MKGVRKMTIKEKLLFFESHGFSITYIANRIGINASTLSKWLKEQKGITHKNEEKVFLTLKEIVDELSSII